MLLVAAVNISEFYPLELEQCFNLLDSCKKEQIEKVADPLSKKQTIVGNVLLKWLLSTVTKRSVVEIVLTYGAFGKPSYPLFGISLAHSSHWVFAAISDKNVGIDVEYPTEITHAVIEKVCTKNEIKQLEVLDCSEKKIRFMEFWTKKEALSKYDGRGLMIGFSNYDVSQTKMTIAKSSLIFSTFVWDYQLRGAVCAHEKFCGEIQKISIDELLRAIQSDN